MIEYSKIFWHFLTSLLLVTFLIIPVYAQHDSSVLKSNGDRLTYYTDHEGNRIPDFSHAGYRNGEAELPYYPVKISVEPQPGDDTNRIKGAISFVEGLPLIKMVFAVPFC